MYSCSSIKDYLKSISNYYYGIESATKLEISFPGLQELHKNNKYYYVYKLKGNSNTIGFQFEKGTEEKSKSVIKQLAEHYNVEAKYYMFKLF